MPSGSRVKMLPSSNTGNRERLHWHRRNICGLTQSEAQLRTLPGLKIVGLTTAMAARLQVGFWGAGEWFLLRIS